MTCHCIWQLFKQHFPLQKKEKKKVIRDTSVFLWDQQRTLESFLKADFITEKKFAKHPRNTIRSLSAVLPTKYSL